MVPKCRPKLGKYYDLIKIPHGHIPAPMVNFWSSFPIPIKAKRNWRYYFCPICGHPSFFKGVCRSCDECDEDFAWYYYTRRQRREYFRKLWKRLDYLFLPLLVLLGKAWYVESLQLHEFDTLGESVNHGPEWTTDRWGTLLVRGTSNAGTSCNQEREDNMSTMTTKETTI